MLEEKIKQADAAIADKKDEVKAANAKFEKLRKEYADSDVDVSDVNSEAFLKAEEAMAEAGKLEDELSALENGRASLWRMQGNRGSDASPEAQAATDRIKDAINSAVMPGARVTATDLYKACLESPGFKSDSVRLDAPLGEALSQDELVQLLEGKPLASVVVSDPDGANSAAAFIEPQHRGFIEPRFRPLLLMEMITVLPTTTDTIDYVVETAFTNNAGFTPEASKDGEIDGVTVTAVQGGRKPQSAIDFEKKQTSVKTIAHWVAATRKVLADAPRLAGIIDKRLVRGLLDVVENQIMQGDATDENLRGLLHTAGHIAQARTADTPIVDDMLRQKTALRLANVNPTAYGLYPTDEEEIRLLRDGAGGDDGTGAYLFGPPSQAGATTIWGLPYVSGTQFIEERPVLGDWSTAELYVRHGANVLASDSHMDFFTRNLIAILAEMSLALCFPEPFAFNILDAA